MAASLWEFGGLTPYRLIKRVWDQIGEDDVSNRSAALSYYFFLALFPLLLFLATLLGFFAAPGSAIRTNLLSDLGRLMPGSASELVTKTLDEVTKAAGGGKLVFGLLAALWAASSGMQAIMQALNVAYRVQENRPWWKS